MDSNYFTIFFNDNFIYNHFIVSILYFGFSYCVFHSFLVTESALSFPGISRWLEIQQKVISLFLGKWYIQYLCG